MDVLATASEPVALIALTTSVSRYLRVSNDENNEMTRILLYGVLAVGVKLCCTVILGLDDAQALNRTRRPMYKPAFLDKDTNATAKSSV